MSETKTLPTTWPPPTVWPPSGMPPEWCRPPTSVWPPCPPPGPWPAGLFRINSCLEEVNEFKAFLTRVIKDIIAEDPSIIAKGTPIVGVTDGTDATKGMVGEFMQMSATIGFVGNTPNFQAFVSVGSLPAGDWDCWYEVGTTTPYYGTQIFLDPIPAGFSGDMDTVLYTPGLLTPETFFLNSVHVRALISVTTPLLFNVHISPGPTNGSLGLIFMARRRR